MTPEDLIQARFEEQRVGHRYSRQAAKWVSIMSGAFVLVLLGYLFYSANLQQVALDIAPLEGDDITRESLEAQYMHLKAKLLGHALIYRFSVSAAAIVVSLTAIVLGSVLILDRVISEDASSLSVTNGDQVKQRSGWSFLFQSTFPGLFLALFGSLTLAFGVYIAGPGAKPVMVRDVPVYLGDLNENRNSLGIRSQLIINAQDEGDENAAAD